MPCSSAYIKKLTKLSPDETVADVMKLYHKKNIDGFPVVDDEGKLAGFFSLQIMLENLLPVSASLGGIQGLGGVNLRAAPGIAKRLKKLQSVPVRELMSRNPAAVNPDTALWEGVSILVETGQPVMVVEKESGKFLGMMDKYAALAELERMMEKEELA